MSYQGWSRSYFVPYFQGCKKLRDDHAEVIAVSLLGIKTDCKLLVPTASFLSCYPKRVNSGNKSCPCENVTGSVPPTLWLSPCWGSFLLPTGPTLPLYWTEKSPGSLTQP